MNRLLVVWILSFCLSGCLESSDSGPGNKMAFGFGKQRNDKPLMFADVKSVFSDVGTQSLAKAVQEGDIARIKKLIADGVDVNAAGENGMTALFFGLRNYDGFRVLLEYGANPNVVTDDGQSVLHWAVRAKDDRFISLALRLKGDPNLVAGQFGNTLLHEAASPEGKDKVTLLLDHGADINAQRYDGDTPMLRAAGLGQYDVVYELLVRGADPRVKNHNGFDLMGVIDLRKHRMDPQNELTKWMWKVIEFLGS